MNTRGALAVVVVVIAGCTAPTENSDPAPRETFPAQLSSIRPADPDLIGGSPVGVIRNFTFSETQANRLRVWFTLQNGGASNRWLNDVTVYAKNEAGEVLGSDGYGSVFQGISARFLRPGQVTGAWSDIYLQPGQEGKTKSVQFEVTSSSPFGKVAGDWHERWDARVENQRWIAEVFELEVSLTNSGPVWRGIEMVLVTYDAKGRAVGVGETSESASSGETVSLRVATKDSEPDDSTRYDGAGAAGRPAQFSFDLDYSD